MTQDKTIILHIFNDLQLATIAQEKLKENGISSFLENENPIGLNPLGGVELKILKKNKDKAEQIIQQ